MATVDERVAKIEGRLDVVGGILTGKAAPAPGGGDPALVARLAALEEAFRRLVAINYNDEVWHQGVEVSAANSRSERFILDPLGGERQVGDGVKK